MSRRARVALLGLLALVIPLAVYAAATRVMVASDDNLWLSFSIDKALHRDAGTALETGLIADAKSAQAPPEAIFRLAMRSNYDGNYRLALLAWAGLDRFASRHGDLNRRVVERYTRVLPLVLAIPWLLLLWQVWQSRPFIALAAAGVLAWYGLILAVDAFEPFYIPFGRPLSLLTLADVALFPINPGPHFSIFGITPRSMVSVLVTAAALARWAGRPRVGYALLALCAGIHTSLALMVIACVLGGDVMVARQRLRDPVSLAILAAAAAYVLANERMLSMVAPAIALVGVCAALLALPALVWWVRREPALPRRAGPVAWLEAYLAADPARAALRQDVIIFGLALGIALMVSGIVSQFIVSHEAVWYFWGQLPTRLFSAAGPAAMIGLAALLLPACLPPQSCRAAAVTLLLVSIITCALHAGGSQTPRSIMLRQLTDLAARAARPGCDKVENEAMIYYRLGHAIREGTPVASICAP